MNRSLKELLQAILPLQQAWKLDLLQCWPEIVGDLCDKIKVEKICDDGTLVVGVTNSAWMQEAYFLSPILLKKINATLAQTEVKQLRFKYSSPRKRLVVQKSAVVGKVVPTQLSDCEARALHCIADQELCDELRRFLMRCRYEKGRYEGIESNVSIARGSTKRVRRD